MKKTEEKREKEEDKEASIGKRAKNFQRSEVSNGKLHIKTT